MSNEDTLSPAPTETVGRLETAHQFVQLFAATADGWHFETDEDARRHDEALERAIIARDSHFAPSRSTPPRDPASEAERNEAVRRAAVMQGRFDEAMNQVERLTKERDRARAQERAEVLDEVSYRWDRRNEVGKPFSEWLWEWVNQARDAARAAGTRAPDDEAWLAKRHRRHGELAGKQVTTNLDGDEQRELAAIRAELDAYWESKLVGAGTRAPAGEVPMCPMCIERTPGARGRLVSAPEGAKDCDGCGKPTYGRLIAGTRAPSETAVCGGCGGNGKASNCTGCAGERNSHVAECGIWRPCYACKGTGRRPPHEGGGGT